MKIVVILLLLPITLLGQKSGVNPKAQPFVNHKLISCTRSQIGFELNLQLADNFHDDTIREMEVFHADSTVSFVSVVYPNIQYYRKGELLKNHFFVVDDTISMNDKIAPIGTFKDYYPKDSLFKGNAYAAYFENYENDSKQYFFVPKISCEIGSLQIGDTINLIDKIGKNGIGRIKEIEVSDQFGTKIKTPFFTSLFVNRNHSVSIVYEHISGDFMSLEIQISKD